MYSLEEKMKAVMLFIESNRNERIVFRTLGYPSPNALRNWYKEYQQTGRLKEHRKQVVKFNEKQKEFAVNHFLDLFLKKGVFSDFLRIRPGFQKSKSGNFLCLSPAFK